jgi:hypothetical protein
VKAVKFALVAVAAMNLAACATIVRGTEEQISVNTDPVGAKVRFSNGVDCIGPCTIKAPRNQALQLTITKEGCATQTATMVPTLAGAGVILGGLIDYGTGAVYDLRPNPLTVTLACRAIPQPTAALAPGRTHERAPVILEPEERSKWLGPGQDARELLAAVRPERFEAQ